MNKNTPLSHPEIPDAQKLGDNKCLLFKTAPFGIICYTAMGNLYTQLSFDLYFHSVFEGPENAPKFVAWPEGLTRLKRRLQITE